MVLENNGLGNNISVQTLDAILCHNGELLENKYYPVNKTKEDFLNEYNNSYKNKEISKKLKPMTLEGCVVRISDIIGYIGRDIEDAIRLNIINKSDIPKSITNILGSTNREIVNNIILDIVNNSFNKPYIKLSKPIFNALNSLIKFNYEHIYNAINAKREISIYEEMYYKLFNTFLSDLKNKNMSSDIYKVYLNDMSDTYLSNNSDVRKVIDYIAGMTDDYFIDKYNKISQIKIKR